MFEDGLHGALRAILALLPQGARHEYRGEIADLVWRRRTALGAAGPTTVVAFWLREICAAIWAVGAAWWDLRTGGSAGPGRPRSRWADLQEDVRFALRGARRHPWETAAIVVSLGIGLGASVAVASLVEGVVVNPLALHDTDGLVRVFQASAPDRPHGATSYPMLHAYRSADTGLAGPAGVATIEVEIEAGDVVDRVQAGLVTGDFFDVLRVAAFHGRTLQSADDLPGSAQVAMLAYGLAGRLFPAASDAVGRAVRVGGTRFEIVGITPARFRGISLEVEPQVWIPVSHVREVAEGGLHDAPNVLQTRAFAWIDMVARVEDGTTRSVAASRLAAVARAARREWGEDSWSPAIAEPILLTPIAEAALLTGRADVLRFLALLGSVVFLTFAAGCANACHLLWARAQSRAGEMSVRLALGASRTRLVEHALVESVMLAIVGGGLGLVLTAAQLGLLRTFSLPGGVPLDRIDVSLDPGTLATAGALTVIAAALVSVAPLCAPFLRPRPGEKPGSGPGWRLGEVLLAAQIGASLVLLFGALLFERTLQAALRVDLGFQPERVGAVTVVLGHRGETKGEAVDVLERLIAAVEASPSILRAAASTHLPLAPANVRLRPERIGGEVGDRSHVVNVNVVSDRYFETLGVPTILGRTFVETDRAGDPVVVVNEAAVAELGLHDRDVGARLRLFPGLEPVVIVGVVADHRAHGVREAVAPYLFLPVSQNSQFLSNRIHVSAESGLDGWNAASEVAARLGAFDPGLVVEDARALSVQVGRVLATERFARLLLSILAIAALAVSAVGVYGMVALSVRRRWSELGIRVTLGAGSHGVIRAAVGPPLSAVLAGMGAGLLTGLLLSRLASGFLFGVEPWDAASLLGTVLILGSVAIVAATGPALRALRIDPRQVIDGG